MTAPRRTIAVTRVALGVALLAATALAGCAEGRERIDVPRLSITVDDTVSAPRDTVSGSVTALDESGVVYIAVRLVCNGKVVRNGSDNFPRRDSITVRFRLDVPENIVANSLLEVQSETIDDQEFSTRVSDTLPIRVAGVPAGPSPAGGCATTTAAR